MGERVLSEIRTELLAIRTRVDHVLEKLAALGAGFGPASDVPPVTDRTRPGIVDQIRDVLPQDLLEKITIVPQDGGFVTVTATWLGKEAWGSVDRKVTQMGGRWIRDGKNSRWEVPVP